MKLDLAAMAAAFIGGTLIALLFGADNTGIALGVGQIAFAIACVATILRPKPG